MNRSQWVRWCVLIVVVLFILPFGCAHRYYFEPTITDQTGRFYVPKQVPIKPGMVLKPEFDVVDEVALINIQKDQSPHLLGEYTHIWTGDLHLWTDSAIGVLKMALVGKDVTIREDAAKQLMLSVTHAELFWGFKTVGCHLNLLVITGDGYEVTFEVTNKSTDLPDSIDGAVTKAVAKMFDDDGIREYLKAPEGLKDSDCDGVYDDKDECPDTPRGVAVDEKGCPLVLDSDGDGVLDDQDECPDTPKGAIVDKRGCWVIDGAFFDFDKYLIKPQYYSVLDHVVDVMKNNPDLTVEVQGHCDNRGTMEYNQILSENRAKAAMNYFVNKGIQKDRFTIQGFSFTKPIATNETDEGRALNRRVELQPVRR